MCDRTYVCPGGEERTGPCPITASDRNVLYENRMLGLPRIRQVHSPDAFRSKIFNENNEKYLVEIIKNVQLKIMKFLKMIKIFN